MSSFTVEKFILLALTSFAVLGRFCLNKPLALLRHVGPCLVSQKDGRPIFLSRLASKVSKDHISGCRGAAVGSLPFTKNT